MTDSSGVRHHLSRWKRFLLEQKVRFDMGLQLLVFLNFALLIIASSDKLRYYTGIPRTWVIVALAVPLGFFGVWLVGTFLDRVVRYGQSYNEELAKRNPVSEEQRQTLMRIEKKIDEILSGRRLEK